MPYEISLDCSEDNKFLITVEGMDESQLFFFEMKLIEAIKQSKETLLFNDELDEAEEEPEPEQLPDFKPVYPTEKKKK